MTAGDGSYLKWFFMSAAEATIFAESLEAPDFVARGWCKPVEEITEADARAYTEKWCLKYREDRSVERTLGAGAFWAACQGNLPMLRFFHERRGVPLDSPSPIGSTPIMMVSHQGCDEVVKYICESKLRNFFCSDAIERWNSRK